MSDPRYFEPAETQCNDFIGRSRPRSEPRDALHSRGHAFRDGEPQLGEPIYRKGGMSASLLEDSARDRGDNQLIGLNVHSQSRTPGVPARRL
jgi:hypothetical protein